jgi:hypothetical protein
MKISRGFLFTRWSIMGALVLGVLGQAGVPQAAEPGFSTGKPAIQSMSALAFGPDGVLFVGDGKAGAVFALALEDKSPRETNEAVGVSDIEARIGALLGTSAEKIMIHDLAVNPISQNTYLAVSRGRGQWDSRWKLPNDVADADILLPVAPVGEISVVSLQKVSHARADLPNPVDASKGHKWKDGISLRADTITDMTYDGGILYIAGLSNEEFSSTMWRVAYPFQDKIEATTLEIFHGAHGEYETHAPIRAFVPYTLKDESHLLAAYLCTPLVTFSTEDLKDGQHIKGRTVAEFGSGNYPLDMLVYQKGGEDRLLIANSNLPFMIVDPDDVADFQGSITTEVKGYTEGVTYEIRSGTGVQQMDRLNEGFILMLQRLPGGTLDMVSMPVERF